MPIKNADLKRRIIEISYKKRLSHLGSCISAVDIIDEIYQEKSKLNYRAPFVLSSGHAGLALYCVIEKYEGKNAEKIFEHHGVHPDRCIDCGIDCSSGSLGHGLGIAVGMALADRTKNVFCLISDGETSEGSIWEALRVLNEQGIQNLYIYVNANGWGAYKAIPTMDLEDKLTATVPDGMGDNGIRFILTNSDDFPFLKDLDAHYHVMDEEEYKVALKVLEDD